MKMVKEARASEKGEQLENLTRVRQLFKGLGWEDWNRGWQRQRATNGLGVQEEDKNESKALMGGVRLVEIEGEVASWATVLDWAEAKRKRASRKKGKRPKIKRKTAQGKNWKLKGFPIFRKND